jgi:hypothetical protein
MIKNMSAITMMPTVATIDTFSEHGQEAIVQISAYIDIEETTASIPE